MLRKFTTILIATTLISATFATPASASLFGDSAPKPEIVTHDGSPSFVVTVQNESELESWADASASRTLVETYSTGNQTIATVAAPRSSMVDVTLTEAVTGPTTIRDAISQAALIEEPFVTDVAPNYNVSLAEPVSSLQNASNYEQPTDGRFAFDDPALPTSGMAFAGDTPETNMSEARSIVGLDNVSTTGNNVSVAIIDTGLNRDNGATYGNQTLNASVDVLGNTTTNVTEGGWDVIDDKNGHGTWTASAVHQIAPNASLLVVQALNEDGSGSTADTAQAIRYAADQNVSVISMSLGSPIYSEALADAVSYALKQNTTVVSAVGNSRQTWRWVATPADVEGVIGVAATNGTAAATAGSAYFSNIGPSPGTTDSSDGKTAGEFPTIAAPGMAMTAPTPSGPKTLSGTSMSTPIVAGGIAAVLEAHPDWKNEPATVREWVRKSSRPIPHAAKAEVGHGMFAADNLNDTWNPKDQRAAMTSAAEQRGTFYRALSQGQGRFLPVQRLSEVVSV